MSRLLALALLLALVGVIVLGLALPYAETLAAWRESADSRQTALDRTRAVVAAPRPEPASLAGLVLPAGSDAQAASSLQEIVKGFAGANGIALAGVQVLPGGEIQGVIRVALRIRGSGALEGIQRFLHAIEDSRPVLVIEQLRLQSRSLKGASAQDPLELQLDVAGYRL